MTTGIFFYFLFLTYKAMDLVNFSTEVRVNVED